MADEDHKAFEDCGPSNKELGIDYGELKASLKKYGTDPLKSLFPIRGKLTIQIVSHSCFNTRARCDVCSERAGITCRDGVVRCKRCRFRYSASFRWKPWKRKVLT